MVEYFLENYLIEKLNFEVKLGQKNIDKQQISIDIFGSLSKTHHKNFSENLANKDTDKINVGRDKNIHFAEKVIKKMSGNLHIEKSENSVKCGMNFWVTIVRD